MMETTKAWYSNTEDVEEFQAYPYKWSGFTTNKHDGKLAVPLMKKLPLSSVFTVNTSTHGMPTTKSMFVTVGSPMKITM